MSVRWLVVLTGLSVHVFATAAVAEPVWVGAVFAHPDAARPYVTYLTGEAQVEVQVSANGAVATWPLGLGEGVCRLAMIWAPVRASQNPLAALSGPIDVCLVRAGVDPEVFETWVRGNSADDPVLVVPLAVDLQQPDRLVNATDMSARLLVRSCDAAGARYRVYAELAVEAGALSVAASGGQPGLPGIRLEAHGVRLVKPDASTWTEVVRACGNADARLPAQPVPGAAARLVADSALRAEMGSASAQALEGVRVVLDDAVADASLGRPDGVAVAELVDRTKDEVRSGDLQGAAEALEQLAAVVPKLVPPEVAKKLAAPIDRTRATIGATLVAPAVIPTLGCSRETTCVPVVFHVDAATTAPPDDRDGTAGRPFGTLTEALARAAAVNPCGVRLVVEGGTYADDLTITRDTEIAGAGKAAPDLQGGSIVNDGPHALTVDHVTFSDSRAGAIRVTHPCAATRLSTVTIRGASGPAILQAGGTLDARNVLVQATVFSARLRATGLGIDLRDGVRAALTGVVVTGSQGGALVVQGAETRVLARRLEVSETQVQPLSTAFGAVIVDHDGLLLAEASRISHNEAIALHVRNRSRAHFRDGVIERTVATCGLGLRLTCPWGPTSAFAFGVGVGAYDGAVVELASFTSTENSFIGLQVAEAWMTASDGLVSHNAIGAHVFRPPADILHCLDLDTHYRDNGINLSRDGSLPVPGLFDLPSVPDSSDCVRVPFTCDWCSY